VKEKGFTRHSLIERDVHLNAAKKIEKSHDATNMLIFVALKSRSSQVQTSMRSNRQIQTLAIAACSFRCSQ
jgi:hypothetical protein